MAELPDDVQQEAFRLTKLIERTGNPDEQDAYRERRDNLLAEYSYTARIREDDSGRTLVCYPEEWVVDGTVYPDRIDDIDRGVELPLSGTGDPDEWDSVWEHNRLLAEEIREEHGEIHGDNITALAQFASNHYAKPIESLTEQELAEFKEEYFPRNAWPSQNQQDAIDESLSLIDFQ